MLIWVTEPSEPDLAPSSHSSLQFHNQKGRICGSALWKRAVAPSRQYSRSHKTTLISQEISPLLFQYLRNQELQLILKKKGGKLSPYWKIQSYTEILLFNSVSKPTSKERKKQRNKTGFFGGFLLKLRKGRSSFRYLGLG